jgi:cyclopropane fatty-acyl-phospholipid synthase-like methyltransferase
MKTRKHDPYDNLANYAKKAIPQKHAGERLLSLAEIQKNDVVLDAGCGPGTLTVKIAKKAKHVVGVDSSGQKILEAKRSAYDYSNLSFEKALLQEYCNKNKFTLIFSNSVMHWISKDNHKKTLDNFYEMLAPGGRIALQLVGGNPYRGLFHSIFRAFLIKYNRYYSCWTPPWFYPRNITTYEKILRASGFTNIRASMEAEKYVHTADDSMNFFCTGWTAGGK